MFSSLRAARAAVFSFVDDVLGRTLRREERVPAGRLELGQTLLGGRRDVRDDRKAILDRDDQSVGLFSLHGRHDGDRLIADIINLAPEQRIQRRPGPAERHVLRLYTRAGISGTGRSDAT